MSEKLEKNTGQCRCGKVSFDVTGSPILSVTCHCESCQKVARQFADLPGAPQVLNADGGTDFAMFRKDRVTFLKGQSLLRSHRLMPEATTRRVLASCCSSPLFLEFKGGHWLSVYRDRLGAGAPAIEMRVMTKDRRAGVMLSEDVPSYETHSLRFMWRLFAAWAAMGFRAPKLAPISEAQ